ncbi:MAG: filamentous hemagglutinin N-terminal domain-containing protein, partial [Sulfuricurvum sp.]|nr:filamentous hemagglutinin N-terminal domain-containing protein [Sulfuricurvum sp.]
MRLTNNYRNAFRILKGGKISLVVSVVAGSITILCASPSGGTVTSGSAAISQNGSVTTIRQASQKTTINWQDFSIAKNETVNFNQPNSSAVALNRVVGNEKSIIDGTLNANGQVWILNSNGVLFNSTASINTAGILATTKALSDTDFNAGNYNFQGDSTASVINMGTIDISNSGYAVLLANTVQNDGTITAMRGKVHLTGANEATINLNGNSLVSLTINKGVLDALVENKGAIIADGGQIFLTTNAVNELLKGVVNNTGVVEANSLDDVTGHVEMFAHGGATTVSGSINAVGGSVETSGQSLHISNNTTIKAKEWLLDPTDITIESIGGTDLASSSISAGTIDTTLNNGTDITLTADNNINVNQAMAWNQSLLTLTAGNDININAQMDLTSTAGLALQYGQVSTASGNLATYNLNAPINIATTGRFSTTLGSDGTAINYIIIDSLGSAGDEITGAANSLQGLAYSTNLLGNYALGANIDASSTSTWNSNMGLVPIGNATTNFTGTFDGLGHTISNLKIYRISGSYIGLFGRTGTSAVVKNIGLVNENITGRSYVGGLAGYNAGSITDSYATGRVAVSSRGTYGGGLVGYNTGLITDSYATGSVTGVSAIYVGGLAGRNAGSITDSYATASVSNSGSSFYTGGLAGSNSGSITDSYAIGSVSGSSAVGGLVGSNSGGSITNSFWDMQTSGKSTSAGGTGKTTAEMQTLSTYVGWTITGSDGTYPTFSANGGWHMGAEDIALNYALSDITSGYIYNGSSYDLSSLWGASTIFGSGYSSWVYGTDYTFIYGGNTITGFTNAGTYSNIAVDVLKSGYTEALSSNTAGSFTITPKALSITAAATADKVYDGLRTSSTTAGTLSGFVGSETLTASVVGTFADKNAASGIIVADVYTLADGTNGGVAINYSLADTTSTATIAKADLSVSGLTAAGKTYDATTLATLGGTAAVIALGEDT